MFLLHKTAVKHKVPAVLCGKVACCRLKIRTIPDERDIPRLAQDLAARCKLINPKVCQLIMFWTVSQTLLLHPDRLHLMTLPLHFKYPAQSLMHHVYTDAPAVRCILHLTAEALSCALHSSTCQLLIHARC